MTDIVEQLRTQGRLQGESNVLPDDWNSLYSGGQMKLKPDAARRILDECIESGLQLGYNRAHKHNDNPTQGMIEEAQNAAIWNEIYEWFDFPEVVE